MTPDQKQKIKTILERVLNREAKSHELINAETDQGLINMLILEELAELRGIIKK